MGRNTNYSQIKICLGSEGIKLRHKDRKSLVRLLLLSGASLFSFFLSSFLLLAPFLKNFFLFSLLLIHSLFFFQVGHKRFIGGIIAAFTLFNDLADFMGRVNNVVGWFDNIDRFMGSGGTESESEVNVAEINELKTRLDGLATDVESKIELRMFDVYNL